ncbi:MBL fold metallo-hydrolase [Candidatus Microgenomates bacterium]|nr:MBL fold metallo-hydrolase [Candidatus Microgenomates bacterium]
MLKVISLTVGQLKTNCYIVYDEKSEEGVIIDPGDDGQYITVSCLDKNITPKAVVATHGHFDHVLGAMEIKLVFNISFMMNKKDEFLLDRQETTAEYFLGVKSDPPGKIDISLEEAGEIKIGESTLKIIETPGHTPGSVCFISNEDKMIFVGDLLFADKSTGEANHKYSSPIQLHDSIKRIKSEFRGYTAYPGHGEIFTL